MWKQAGSLDLLETITQGLEHEERNRKLDKQRREVRARAYASVCHSFGIKFDEMTDSHRAVADQMEARMLGGGHSGRGYGFSISTVDRKPEVK